MTAVVLIEALKGVLHKGPCIFLGLLRLAALLGSSPLGYYRSRGRHPVGSSAVPESYSGVALPLLPLTGLRHSPDCADAEQLIVFFVQFVVGTTGRLLMVACGVAHTITVTSAGNAYSCGLNEAGQLGLGDKQARKSFARVSLRGIVMAACGLKT